jgi:Domain of unknown function (DUF4845)
MRNTLTNQHYNSKKQVGATMLGMLFIGGLLVFVALLAMKIFPAYQEFFSVKKIVRNMNKDSLSAMSKGEIIASFNKRVEADYVTVIKGSDLSIGKNSAGETEVTAKYQVVTPLFGNISAQIDFETNGK